MVDKSVLRPTIVKGSFDMTICGTYRRMRRKFELTMLGLLPDAK
jgi:hypothetical protein